MKKGSKIFKKNDNSQKDNTLNYSSFAKTIRRSDHTIMVITKVDIATTKVDIATVSLPKPLDGVTIP